jgi:hypothetical protein
MPSSIDNLPSFFFLFVLLVNFFKLSIGIDYSGICCYFCGLFDEFCYFGYVFSDYDITLLMSLIAGLIRFVISFILLFLFLCLVFMRFALLADCFLPIFTMYYIYVNKNSYHNYPTISEVKNRLYT